MLIHEHTIQWTSSVGNKHRVTCYGTTPTETEESARNLAQHCGWSEPNWWMFWR